jgi:hypothetical protein
MPSAGSNPAPTARTEAAAKGFRRERSVDSVPETCVSGRNGTTGNRVALQGVQGFKSLRLRAAVSSPGLC